MRHERTRSILGLYVAIVSSCASSVAPPAVPETPAQIDLDRSAAEAIIRWAQAGEQTPLPSWQGLRAYELTRSWAKWSGQPNPDEEVERLLTSVEEAKRTSSGRQMIRARAMMEALEAGWSDFTTNAVPHLRSFLPSGTPVKGTVLLAVFIPPYAFAWGDGSIVINLTASFWDAKPEKIFNLLVHELFHNGMSVYRAGTSPSDETTPDGLIENVLWQTQNEGMATYVAYRFRSSALEVEDYQLLESSEAVRARFGDLQQLIDDVSRSEEELESLKKRLWNVGNMGRAFYVVGAHMAREIDERLGRDALIQTVVEGPRSFFSAYEKTGARPALSLSSSRLQRRRRHLRFRAARAVPPDAARRSGGGAGADGGAR